MDLTKRLTIYYKNSELVKNIRPIHQALLKYGYANFKLEILEYCNKDELMKREQHYLDLLMPDYNILKIAYSLAGFKHSIETKANLKAKAIEKGVAVWVLNTKTEEIHAFTTITETGEFLGVSRTSVRNAILKGNRINNIYLITNEGVQFSSDLINNSTSTTVKVLNTKTNEVREFYTQREVGEFLGVTTSAVSMALKFGNTIKDIYLLTNAATFTASDLAKATILQVFNTQSNESINFNKQTELAKYLGVTASEIGRAHV